MLFVRGAAEETASSRELAARLERALALAHVEHHTLEFKSAKTGFMDRQRPGAFDSKSADRAWFKSTNSSASMSKMRPLIAGRGSDFSPAVHPFVSIDDVMHAVNGASGMCGDVAQSLNEGPREEKDWRLLRARAAIMADSGILLMSLKPPKGRHQAGNGTRPRIVAPLPP